MLFHFRTLTTTALAAVLLLLCNTSVTAQNQSVVSVGARHRVDHSVLTDLPYDKGDISYGLAYEWHEAAGYWQLGLYYTPEVNGTSGTNEEATVEYTLTPHLNLILKDDLWRGGVGILRTYVRDEEHESDWLHLNWQLLLGVNIPLFGIKIDLHSYYVFEKWDELNDFDTDDVEFGAWLNIPL